MKRNALALLVSVICASAPRLPASREDVWLWRLARDPKIASDGTRLVYAETWSDRSGDRTYSNLRTFSVDGRQSRWFTEGPWQDRSPRWSPDGAAIAWISDRDGADRLWTAPADGGKPAPLTSRAAPVTSFAWSPDGKLIAYLAAGQLFVTPVLVTPAGQSDARRIGNPDLLLHGEPAWMPDAGDIVCAEKGGEIFAVRVADGATRQLTRTGQENENPTPSPDGSKIAYIAFQPQQSYSVRRLYVMNPDGSRPRQLAGTLDRDVRDPQWSNDSRTVYFLADDAGRSQVYLARNDGAVRRLTGRPERLEGLTLADNGRAAMIRSSAAEGSAVFTFMTDVPTGGWTLIDVNQQLLAERNWGSVEEMPFESAGRRMQAWVVRPFEFNQTRKYPLLLETADTPARMFGAEFPLHAHILAASGFVVMMVNPRGTPGFGEEFGELLPTEIGRAPAEDLISAADAAIALGYVDPSRIFVAGGTAAAWLLGHSDRFAGIIARHPAADLAAYPEHSPIRFADSFKTPTLIVAAAGDAQAEKLRAALQKQKVPVSFVGSGTAPSARIAEIEAELKFLINQRQQK